MNPKPHDAALVALILEFRERCAQMAEGYVYGNAAARAIRTISAVEVQRILATPAQLVRQGLEATPAMVEAEHKRAIGLVGRASDRMRELHTELGLVRHQLAEAQGMLLMAREALESNTQQMREELARAEAALAMREDPPLAAIHGTTAANADSAQAAA